MAVPENRSLGSQVWHGERVSTVEGVLKLLLGVFF